MTFTINAFDHASWEKYGLADYGDFAECITECNQGEDAFSGYGDWWYAPDERLPNGDRVIYFGSWGNDNSPGADSYTFAELFNEDEDHDYGKRIAEWEAYPEFLPVEDDENEDE